MMEGKEKEEKSMSKDLPKDLNSVNRAIQRDSTIFISIYGNMPYMVTC